MTFFWSPDGSDPFPALVTPDPRVIVENDGIALKFQKTLNVASVLGATIQVYTYSATPVLVPNALEPISIANYNTIGRVLTLSYGPGIVPNTQYTVTITGLLDVIGNPLAVQSYTFVSNPAPVITSDIPSEPIYVEDHSIRDNIFTNLNDVIEVDPNFYVVSTDPDSQTPVISDSYNMGVVTVVFNQMPDPNFITTKYFKFQYRPIARGMNPWVVVPNAIITPNPADNSVTISVPSQSATPVIVIPITTTPTPFNYYNDGLGNYGQAYVNAPYPTNIFPYGYGTPDLMFFQDGFKYRLTVSGAVGYTDNTGTLWTLVQDQVIQFLSDPQPMVLDPEEFYVYYPDADPYQVAELIAEFSQVAQNLLKYMITDTLTSLMDNDSIIAQTVQDFVQASVLCALTRIYDVTGGAQQSSITLGDLTVMTNNALASNTPGRSTATTWCELASIVRNELSTLSRKSGMKAIKRGSQYRNPMPKRHIKHAEWLEYSPYSDGQRSDYLSERDYQ